MKIDATPRFDWQTLKTRLAQSSQILTEGATAPNSERIRVLRARAQLLAKELPMAAARDTEIDVVEFRVAYELHALEVKWVNEVWPLTEITSLPGTPPFVKGIIQVRGRILTVLDPKELFQLPGRGLPDFNRVILLSDGRTEFGLLVDCVLGTRHIKRSSMQATMPSLSGFRREYLLGITPEPVVVLDAQKILQATGLQVHS
jgi:purine-binding chemotaxis protein CheW